MGAGGGRRPLINHCCGATATIATGGTATHYSAPPRYAQDHRDAWKNRPAARRAADAASLEHWCVLARHAEREYPDAGCSTAAGCTHRTVLIATQQESRATRSMTERSCAPVHRRVCGGRSGSERWDTRRPGMQQSGRWAAAVSIWRHHAAHARLGHAHRQRGWHRQRHRYGERRDAAASRRSARRRAAVATLGVAQREARPAREVERRVRVGAAAEAGSTVSVPLRVWGGCRSAGLSATCGTSVLWRAAEEPRRAPPTAPGRPPAGRCRVTPPARRR